MINWRSILGLVLLLAGIKQLYTLIALPPAPGFNPIPAGIGCVVWMGVGVYLVIKGTTMKKEL